MNPRNSIRIERQAISIDLGDQEAPRIGPAQATRPGRVTVDREPRVLRSSSTDSTSLKTVP